MAEIFDERYKEVVARTISYDMPLRLKLACALEELDTMDDEEWGAMTYGTMVQAMLEIIESHNNAAHEEAKALVGEMLGAMKSNTAQCAKMHHGKKDQNHEDFGRCPPVERYCAAITKATNWLEGK